MKTKKNSLSVSSFLSGVIITVLLTGLYSFTQNNELNDSGNGVTAISVSEAKAYVNNYNSELDNPSQAIKGYNIDKTQLEAMKLIDKNNSNLIGFRIYIGKDFTSKQIAIVVGVNNEGKDVVDATLYNTQSNIGNPCPPVCDSESPIISD